MLASMLSCKWYLNMQVDEELKGRIHTEMMKAILRFEIREK